MSENDRREIVERVEKDKIFIDEVKDTTEGCVIAVSHDWKYKLILTSSGFQWLNLQARTGDLDLANAKEFGSVREATQWWKNENPHVPVYLYPSMKGVL